ncbi:MAG: hypothetical protein F4069_04810 [Rhodothermaceae bacterium]|nr:hypothetical protein [Rhodothermaceae bacterium]MYG69821.1 hypothetical protein [Rhodothermaceae bacterium]MYJ44634.1 hypothetical protein [Rhodothermaceae bacterium]
MSSLTVTNFYSVQIYKLSADLENKDQVTKTFFNSATLRASITSALADYMSNQTAPAHASLAKDWLPQIKEKCHANRVRPALFLIIEKSTHDEIYTIDAIRCVINQEFAFHLQSPEPLFQNSGNPIAAQSGIKEIQIHSTLPDLQSRMMLDVRTPLTEALLDKKIQTLKQVVNLLIEMQHIRCMGESLATILFKPSSELADKLTFLQLWEIMKDRPAEDNFMDMERSEKDSKKKIPGVVTSLGYNCLDKWIKPRSKKLSENPETLTELQGVYRNAIAHQDKNTLDKIMSHMSDPNSETSGSTSQELLNLLMTKRLIKDIYQFLLEHVKNADTEGSE